MSKTYRLAAASRLTGVRRSDAEYWTRQGVIIPAVAPAGAGSRREYDFANLVELAIARTLSLVFDAAAVSIVLKHLRAEMVWRALRDRGTRAALPILFVGISPQGSGFTLPPASREPGALETMPMAVQIRGGVYLDIALTTTADVAGRLDDGQQLQVAMNIARLIAWLEDLTGETLS